MTIHPPDSPLRDRGVDRQASPRRDHQRRDQQRRETGAWGEAIAAGVLRTAGWEILDRNWRPPAGAGHPRGELDLVCQEGPTVVVCEVKTRSSQDFGHPFEAVDPHKATRLRALAGAWARVHGAPAHRIRIDAVAITGSRTDFRFEHLRAVV